MPLCKSTSSAPLDVWLVRKLGVPEHPEIAMGAIAAGGIEVLNRDLIRDLEIPHALVDQVAAPADLEPGRAEQRPARLDGTGREEHAVAGLGTHVRGEPGPLPPDPNPRPI